MQDPDPKCRHFGILWHFMSFYGVLALLPKSLIGNQIRFFRFYPIFSDFQTFPDFPTSRFHNSSMKRHPSLHLILVGIRKTRNDHSENSQEDKENLMFYILYFIFCVSMIPEYICGTISFPSGDIFPVLSYQGSHPLKKIYFAKKFHKTVTHPPTRGMCPS